MNNIFLAQENLLGSLLPFILMIVIIWFLIIRPQKKRQKEHKNMLENLKTGDKVITNGGMQGIISKINVEKNLVSIKVADNIKIDFLISSIATKILDKKVDDKEEKKF